MSAHNGVYTTTTGDYATTTEVLLAQSIMDLDAMQQFQRCHHHALHCLCIHFRRVHSLQLRGCTTIGHAMSAYMVVSAVYTVVSASKSATLVQRDTVLCDEHLREMTASSCASLLSCRASMSGMCLL